MVMVELVKVIFKLPNLRRAPGPAGQLKRVKQVVHETDIDFFIQRNGTLSRWPTSMQVVVSAFSHRHKLNLTISLS